MECMFILKLIIIIHFVIGNKFLLFYYGKNKGN